MENNTRKTDIPHLEMEVPLQTCREGLSILK